MDSFDIYGFSVHAVSGVVDGMHERGKSSRLI
jgi:hypothetical protein